MTEKLTTIDDVLDLILGQWQQHNLGLGNIKRKNVLKLTDKLLALINQYLERPPIYTDTPQWLPAIDDYFQEQMRQCRLSQFNGIPQYDLEFVAVCVLLTPLVYYDELLRWQSYDDGFVWRIELAFMTRFTVPRDVEEARRMYKVILQLPASYHLVGKVADRHVSQPFRAQMLFASMIMRKSAEQSELWLYQKHLLETCPTQLLDYPGHEEAFREKRSARPAFWMAYSVDDTEFRRILQQRASQAYRDNLAKVLEHEQKRDKSKADVSTDQTAEASASSMLSSSNNLPLITVLKKFDDYLAKHAPELHAGLQAGVKADQLQKLNQALAPLQIPQDVAVLYQWHNGIAYDGFLFGFPDFLALEDALMAYREAVKLGERFSWCKAWYPLCYEGQDYRLISLSETEQTTTPVYSLFLQDGSVTQQFDSIECMVTTYLEAYQAGVIAYNEDDEYWEVDEEQFEQLRCKQNTQSLNANDSDKAYDTWQPHNWPVEWRKHRIGQSE